MAVIIYNSKAGHTYEYALMLSKTLDIPLYSIGEAKLNVNPSQEVIYMSWILGDKIVKLDKMKKYNIIAVCAVGMSENTDEERNKLLSNNNINSPLFKLTGGFESERLKGVYSVVGKVIKKAIQDLGATNYYGNKVDIKNLAEIEQWYLRRKNDL